MEQVDLPVEALEREPVMSSKDGTHRYTRFYKPE